MSDDDFGSDFVLPEGLDIDRHRVFGFGPELTLPIATKKKLIGFLNMRYLWETGARSTLDGTTLAVTVTFPIPSVRLQ
jgi:hypothetical protein